MARIGLNNFRYAIATIGSNGAITYGTVKKPGKAVSFSFEPTTSDATLYADDSLAESDNRVTGGTCTMGIDRLDAETMAEILGHEYNDETDEVVQFSLAPVVHKSLVDEEECDQYVPIKEKIEQYQSSLKKNEVKEKKKAK